MPKPKTSGQQMVESILADMAAEGLEPDARERALLDAAAELRDRMDHLQHLITTDGERTVSDSGIVRLHPAIAEHRQAAVALSKVVATVVLSDTGGQRKDPTKQRAAHARWERQRLAEGA